MEGCEDDGENSDDNGGEYCVEDQCSSYTYSTPQLVCNKMFPMFSPNWILR